MPPILILAGPTGSKKTETAITLAELLGSEIISADSLQVYKYFDIGTAKPASELLTRIPHHLIDILEPDEEFTAFDFKMRALQSMQNIHSRGKTPLLVGGTGLYLKVLTQDYDCAVQIDPVIKSRIQEEIKTRGAPALHHELTKIDPVSAEKIPPTDPQRIERALSVYYQTNQKLSDLHQNETSENSNHDYRIFLLEWERETLYKNINQRVDQMIKRGLVEEVRSLLEKGWSSGLKPFQSIGYKQIIDFFNGKLSLETAVEKIKQETRHYAKRQITWFKKVPNSISIPVTPEDTPKSLRDKIIPKFSQALAIVLIFSLFLLPKEVFAQRTKLQKAGQHIMNDRSAKARALLETLPQDKHSVYLSALLDAKENKKSSGEKLQASLKDYPEIEDYVRYELAQCHNSQKEYPLALDQFETLLKKFPQTALYPETQQLRAKILESLGKKSESVQVLQDTLKELPSRATAKKSQKVEPEVELHLSQLLISMEKIKDADEILKQILINYPDHPNAEIAQTERKKLQEKENFKPVPLTLDETEDRLRALLKQVEYKKVLSEVRELSANKSPLPSDFYFIQARAEAGLGKRAEAIETLQQFIKFYPGNKYVSEAMYKIARHQWNLGQNKESNELFAKIIKDYATSKWAAKAHYILGRMEEDKGNYEKAGKQFLHLAEQHGKTDDGQWAAWRLGWIYYQNKDYNKAWERFGLNAKNAPDGFYIVNNLYWKAKAGEKLKDKNTKALFHEVYDRFPYTYYGLRGLQESSGNETAQNNTIVPVKTVTEDEQQRVLRAKELSSLGLFLHAREELKLLEKNLRKNLSGVVWLAKLYNEAGAFSDSVRLLQLYRNHVGETDEKNLPIDYWKTFYPAVYTDIIHKEAKKNKVDPNFIKGLIKQESLYEEEALSVAGARGLMQIMPATGRQINSLQKLKVSLEEDDDLFDPGINIRLGAAYLKQLEASTGKNKAYKLIAYNAGPRVLKKWKQRFKHIRDRDEFTESIPYPETRNYVKKVLRNYWLYKKLYRVAEFK